MRALLSDESVAARTWAISSDMLLGQGCVQRTSLLYKSKKLESDHYICARARKYHCRVLSRVTSCHALVTRLASAFYISLVDSSLSSSCNLLDSRSLSCISIMCIYDRFSYPSPSSLNVSPKLISRQSPEFDPLRAGDDGTTYLS